MKVTGIINNIFKTSLVQRHTRLILYKILAKPTLVYGSEAWTLHRADERRLTSAVHEKNSRLHLIRQKKVRGYSPRT
jgi:hypothetical protein